MSPGPSTQSCVGREALQQLEFDVVAEVDRRIGATRRSASAAALRLQQEHVVLVHVRADRTAGRGERHHDVVDAPARQEIERGQQRGDIGVPLVDVLHQQRPVVLAELREHRLERAVAQQPAVVLARSCATSRDSAASSHARPARSSGAMGETKPGNALRISSGRFCQ
jgi:hypothetical protein